MQTLCKTRRKRLLLLLMLSFQVRDKNVRLHRHTRVDPLLREPAVDELREDKRDFVPGVRRHSK